MSITIVQGRVTKTGESQYGPWFIVAETVTKKDGDTFEKRYLCSGKTAPADGAEVVVQGYTNAKVSEDGKYANVNLNAAQWHTIGEPPAATNSAPEPMDEDESIPFHHLPYDSIGISRCGHSRW